METHKKDVSSSLRLLKQRMSASKATVEKRGFLPTEISKDAVVVAEPRAPPPPQLPRKSLIKPPSIMRGMTPATSKHALRWVCTHCDKECIPIRSESRCICGHRYKEHAQDTAKHRCNAKNCPCTGFHFIVAEGAWILRCACKHRHTDHDPRGPPYKCTKPGCDCTGFHSPWRCNCDHAWCEHRQEAYERKGLMAHADPQLQDLMVQDTIKRTDVTVPLPGFGDLRL